MKILFFLIFSVIFAKDQSWDEMLLYNASFGGVDVATATLKSKKFKNIQNQDILRIEFKAKSKPSLKYIFPINDKKIVVAKIGKDFSWFSFVTLFITFYGMILYIYGMINIYNVLNDSTTFYAILILTAVTFAIGYWWFVNNTGEKRLREVYDN